MGWHLDPDGSGKLRWWTGRQWTETYTPVVLTDEQFLASLPEGIYYDGTYQWEKFDGDWSPIQAPYGMPRYPERKGLARVHTTYEKLEP